MATNAPTKMKKLVNKIKNLIPESLAGLEAANPNLIKIDFKNNIVLRAKKPKKSKVALISSSGSGHEPLHENFVKLGMLDTTAASNIFTSPVPDQIKAATRTVDNNAGVLHIVKNYTSNVLNFQMTAELVARKIEVSSVVTNDDVAVQDSLYTASRRRVKITILVEKIANTRAKKNGSLADVTATAVKVNAQDRSMSLALTSCIVPAAGTPTFELGDDEVEVRIKIHKKPKQRREKLASIDEMAKWLISPIVSDLRLGKNDSVLAFVNGMGETPLIELYGAFNSINKILKGQKISISRSLVSNYITSLEIAGFSVTLLKLNDNLVQL